MAGQSEDTLTQLAGPIIGIAISRGVTSVKCAARSLDLGNVRATWAPVAPARTQRPFNRCRHHTDS
jgi:hypothetical protein